MRVSARVYGRSLQAPGGSVGLLAVVGHGDAPAAVGIDEPSRLHDQAARAATGVVDAAQRVLLAVGGSAVAAGTS